MGAGDRGRAGGDDGYVRADADRDARLAAAGGRAEAREELDRVRPLQDGSKGARARGHHGRARDSAVGTVSIAVQYCDAVPVFPTSTPGVASPLASRAGGVSTWSFFSRRGRSRALDCPRDEPK